MNNICQKPYEMIKDYITGKEIPNIGAEENRQTVLRFLVDKKKYLLSDFILNADINFKIGSDLYKSQIDILLRIDDQSVMVIKCAAGSLGSREREALSAARLLEKKQIPLSVVSDGNNALIRDVLTGKKIAEGLDKIPSRDEANKLLEHYKPEPMP